ncbi:MAG: hypothetical protein A3G32_00685 [Deltaproteobacteria bacterium RIFCSPLOWO2_12_FULL_40_28]|nr:MAG: hypothetical protein A3C45_09570 [Deltaproteobacteria bacterium RIFCSPHIGHO2_02_FULL_40_28]OGQ19857.1 MAG: hypothetical protein A3E27_06520 [Deltaproteobacteria bacterium RIFCSPHIGHO2_12_FULL_40_32]OGQ39616.1 MAG: hypothetical protein A3I69_05950 [Deltaproteobacteria bacterium RIFCSPLOWO2_02_FULL_40_36]OGQ52872.1 MAG: hypothetical protein A3G32_00685 [Deltaproteobacteria bacterium RIFCSPLOWO2_12_FULL_40_28]
MVTEKKCSLKKSYLKISVSISALISLTVAGLMMWIAMKHNPQGEFCTYIDADNCEIQWLHWSGLGLSWFFPSFLIFMILGFVASKLLGFFYSQK